MKSQLVDIIVVGAGFSGLAAARAVSAAGASVLVLEARDRCGGRTLTRELAGAHVEMGAQWIGPGQPQVKQLAAELGFGIQPKPRAGRDVRYVSDPDGEGPIEVVESPLFDMEQAAQVIVQLDELARTVHPAAPMDAPDARVFDTHTVSSWCDRELSADTASMVRHIVEGFIGLPEQVSLLHALFYAHANGGFASMLGFGGVLHDSEVVTTGLGTLAGSAAAKLGDIVRLNAPVAQVSQQDRQVSVTTNDGSQYTSQAVIFAIPPALAGAIAFSPELPPQRLCLQRRYLPFSRLKFQAVYERPFWRDEGRSGQANGGGFITFDGSVSEQRGVISGFFGAREALRLWRLSRNERAQLATERLALLFGAKARAVLAYDDMYWLDEPFSQGCVAAPGPGVWTNFGSALRERVRRIVWAGTETSVLMPGQVEGAIVSGQRAAREALALIGER